MHSKVSTIKRKKLVEVEEKQIVLTLTLDEAQELLDLVGNHFNGWLAGNVTSLLYSELKQKEYDGVLTKCKPIPGLTCGGGAMLRFDAPRR